MQIKRTGEVFIRQQAYLKIRKIFYDADRKAQISHEAYVKILEGMLREKNTLADCLTALGRPFLCLSGGGYGLCHRSTAGKPWRITWIQKDRKTPTGHTEYETFSAAVHDLFHGGWSFRKILKTF